MSLRGEMERIYRDLTLEDVPWNLESPPEILVRLVKSGWIAPCDAVDLGCGAGNYAVWLASGGFRVTGLDLSSRAIELARRRASERGVDCRFLVADLTGDLREHHSSFDFAYDWEVLHHIFPGGRARYVRNVHRLLRPGGRYLSVCFSEQDPGFGGEGKYRDTRLGTRLYFSSEQELSDLFGSTFHVHELYTTGIASKAGPPHQAVVALMERGPESP
jgi:SAM-dependent methyltransferase